MNKRVIIWFLLLCVVGLWGCQRYTEKNGTRVCGVPVRGTAWELAAAIHDKGDGTFMPETVDEFRGKAYIRGWQLPDELPAVVVCDIEKGKVVRAIVYSGNDLIE